MHHQSCLESEQGGRVSTEAAAFTMSILQPASFLPEAPQLPAVESASWTLFIIALRRHSRLALHVHYHHSRFLSTNIFEWTTVPARHETCCPLLSCKRNIAIYLELTQETLSIHRVSVSWSGFLLAVTLRNWIAGIFEWLGAAAASESMPPTFYQQLLCQAEILT